MSGFCIDEFIATATLAVASRRGNLIPSLPPLISVPEEQERIKIYDVVVSVKYKTIPKPGMWINPPKAKA